MPFMYSVNQFLVEMTLPVLANVEWPSALVACVLIVCLTAGFITAVIRYNSDAAMKLAGYFTGFLGLLLGAITTYFFAQGQVQQQASERKIIETAFQDSQKQSAAAGQQLLQVATKIKRQDQWLDPRQAAESLESIATMLVPQYVAMKGTPRPSPSPHATPDKLFHDLLKRNTASPSPENP
jgi:hypothetical protein